MAHATFYFDLGSPYAYLTAARIDALLGESVDWQPISLGALFKLAGRSSWSVGDQQRREDGMAEVERRARAYGLPPVCWPEPWPGNYLMAMRAATYAQRIGRLREFADNAFRRGFEHGHDLSVPANVLAAASDAGLDPPTLERAVGDPEIKLALREATEDAYRLGVVGVPTVIVGGEPFWGDDRLEQALTALGRVSADR